MIGRSITEEIKPRWLRIVGYWYPRGDIPAFNALAHVHRDAVIHAIGDRCFSSDDGPLPSIALGQHALLECRAVGEASDVTGLAIAKIERRLRGRRTTGMSVRPDQIPIGLVDGLPRLRGDTASQQQD